MIESLKCRDCGQDKPPGEFPKSRHGGRQPLCRPCWGKRASAGRNQRVQCLTCNGSFPAAQMAEGTRHKGSCQECAVLLGRISDPARLLKIRQLVEPGRAYYCHRCDNVKGAANFSKSTKRYNGLKEHCRDCDAVYQREFRANKKLEEAKPTRRRLPAKTKIETALVRATNKRADRESVQELNSALAQLNGSTDKVRALLRDVWTEVSTSAAHADARVERITFDAETASITFVRTETIPL